MEVVKDNNPALTQDKTVILDPQSIVYVGCRDKEKIKDLVDKISFAFGGKVNIKIVDSPLMNYIDDMHMRSAVDMKEKGKLDGFKNDPERFEAAMKQAEFVWKHVQNREGATDEWFSLKELVDNSNLTYPAANDLVDILYIFGLIAYSEFKKPTDEKKRRYFTITISLEEKLAFLTYKENEAKALAKTYANLKKVAKEQEEERQRVLAAKKEEVQPNETAEIETSSEEGAKG